MKKTFIGLLFLFILINQSSNKLYAQDSSRLRISLLTCTPGDELYSLFGHSAIRIIDSSNIDNNYFDIVYNYGTFNFDDPGFYLKFIRGKLLYYISIEEFNGVNGFKNLYQSTGRGITEQVLFLSETEKKSIQHSLNENLKEENKYYKYDFFLDNCTTRLRDMLVNNKHPQPLLPTVMPVNTRFRQAIHQYLDKGKQYWSKLGIDILLGTPTDAVMTTAQQQFLPDNLMRSLDSCKNVSLVQSSENLYSIPGDQEKSSWFTPMLFFSLLLSSFILLSLSKNKFLQTILKGLDGSLFFLTGLLGIVLILMWTATDHSMTKNNYNLLWAWPTHIIMSFFINSNKIFVKRYFLVTSVGLAGLLLTWFFLPQQMNNALLPFVLLLLYRSAMKTLK
ncbi:MAG: DUF4105 domain-containing protein [Ferruginibacter sp.]